MIFFAGTDNGKKHKSNEDFFVLPTIDKSIGIDFIDNRKGNLFLICDGMGGTNAGEVASKLSATWILKEYYGKKKTILDNLKNVMNKKKEKSNLPEIIQSVNKRIYKLSKDFEQYNGMGTTLIATLFKEKKLSVYSIGDSRCYRLRNKEFMQLNEDQSEVWKLYKMGAITKDEIRTHPRNNLITMAIGTSANVEINSYEYDIQKDDIYLLCSDGLTDMVAENEIKTIVSGDAKIDNKIQRLIDSANDAGGKDNITAILIKI